MSRSVQRAVAVAVFAAISLTGASPSFAACSNPFLPEVAAVPLGHDAVEMAWGDVNGDELLDLVTSSTTDGNVKVRLGNGNGTFGPAETYPAASAGDLVLGDLNGDTYPDIIVSKEPAQTAECVSFGSCASFNVLFNEGDGTFGTATPTVVPYAASISALDARDFDGDGKVDVVVGAPPLTATDPAMHLFVGNGSGGFPTRNSWAVDGAVLDARGVDLGNSVATLAVLLNASQTEANTRLLLYPAASNPNPQPTLTRGMTNAVLGGQLTDVADFNGDGWLDIVAALINESSSSLVLLSAIQSNPVFITVYAEHLATFPDVAAADLDESGRADVAVALDYNAWFVSRDGVSSPARDFIAQGGTMHRVATVDFTHDGRTDLAYLDTLNDAVVPLVNLCNSRYATAVLNASPSPSTYGGSVTLTATITPKPGAPLPTGTVTFYEGAQVLGTAPLAAAGDSANAILNVSSLGVGSHDIHAVYGGDSDFGTVTTNTIAHTVQRAPFGAPLNVVATGNGSAATITIRWVSTDNAVEHDVLRRQNGAWITIGTTTNEVFVDSNVVPTSAYIYAVRSRGGASGTEVSPNSAPDIATTATLALPSDRKIRASDWTSTRQLIASLRAAVGATPFTFTDVSLVGLQIKAVHLTELRAALTPPRNAIGLPPVTFTNPTPTVRVTTVKLVDLQEIRNSFQ